MIRQAAILLLLTLTCAAGTHFLHPRAPAWHLSEEPLRDDEVSMAVIAERWGGDVLWIDARIESRYEEAHVPGAILINEQHFDAQLFDQIERLQDNKKPVIVYCDAATCEASHKVKTALLERLGIEDIYVLKGGWQAWQDARGK